MTIVKAIPSSEDKTVLVNGVKLAAVVSVKEFEKSSVYKIECFGDDEPAAVLTNGTEYGVELRRETPATDGVSFDGLADFTVKVGNVVYGGCRCAKRERTIKPGEPETELVTINAASRQEAEDE